MDACGGQIERGLSPCYQEPVDAEKLLKRPGAGSVRERRVSRSIVGADAVKVGGVTLQACIGVACGIRANGRYL